MSKVFYLCILLLGSAFLPLQVNSAEIPVYHVKNNSAPEVPAIFDGSKNFMGDNVKAYIGQELLLLGKAESLRKYGYEGFTTDYLKDPFMDKSIIYGCCAGVINSSYEKLAGKTFVVLDVIPHPKAKKIPSIYGKQFFLKLKDKDSHEIIYFKYSSKFKHAFPFVVLSYFEHEKERLSGAEFVVRGRNWVGDGPMLDVITSKPIDFMPGGAWRCKDLAIEDKSFSLSLLLQNEKGENIFLGINRLDNNYFVFTKSDADKYKKRFGQENWLRVLKGKARAGMTKEMIELSWGKPEKINRTVGQHGNTEQWVYGDNQYLYFDGNTLTTLQVPR